MSQPPTAAAAAVEPNKITSAITTPPATSVATAAPAQPNDFSQQAGEAQPSLLAEFLDFLVHNQAWWLTPIIVVLLLVGLLVIFGAGAAGPFIYTLF